MKKMVGVMVVIGVLALGVSLAYAQGPGWGWGPGYGRGPGWGSGWGAGASLTPEERAELDKQRQEHWTEMGKLRTQILAKRTELAAARRAGDQAKVEAVTKDLNALYAEQATKRDEFRTKAAEITGTDLPAAGPGFGRGMGRGFGPGMGRGMGMGYGPGYGPNCPMWQ